MAHAPSPIAFLNSILRVVTAECVCSPGLPQVVEFLVEKFMPQLLEGRREGDGGEARRKRKRPQRKRRKRRSDAWAVNSLYIKCCHFTRNNWKEGAFANVQHSGASRRLTRPAAWAAQARGWALAPG